MSLLPADLAERPRFSVGGAPVSPHLLLVVDNAFVPPGHSVITEDGVQGLTVLDLPDRWDELTDDTRVRLHLEDVDEQRRVQVAAVLARQEPIRGFADPLSVP